MLDPELVLSTVVSAFQSIPALVSEMGGLFDENGNPTIYGHRYVYGVENSLTKAVYGMTSPSILVAYKDILTGNFDSSTLWKHRLEAYIRPKNAASGAVGGTGGTVPSSPPHLWWLMINSPVLGGPQNIRGVSLLNHALIPMDPPSLSYRMDENEQDLFVGTIVIPEYGDN
jgi:hypothetical protein